MVSSTDIAPVAEALIKAVRPVSIYLFGSVARTGHGNDLDLLVIAETDMEFIDSIYRGQYPAEAGLLPLGEPNAEDAQRACAIGKRLVR